MFYISSAFVGGALAFGSERPINSVLVHSDDENKNVSSELKVSSSLRIPHSRATCLLQYHGTAKVGLITQFVAFSVLNG